MGVVCAVGRCSAEMSVFGSFKFGEEVFGGSGGGIPPTPNFDERIPWTIANYSGGQTYAFEINPLDATVPSFKRTITTQSTAAGRQINYEGRRQPQTITVSGTILSEDQYNTMDAWARVRKQVKITDDLGEGFWVYVERFSPTRQKSTQFPWHMEYSLEATVLDWS